MKQPTIDELIQRGYSLIPTALDKKPCRSLPWTPYQTLRPTIEEMQRWAAWEPSSWAIVTGALSNIVTFDFDGPAGVALAQRWNIQPHRRSGSGGLHLDVVHPGWRVPTLNSKTSKNSLGKRWPGLDVRGDGGYVIALGSNQNGSYEWLRDPAPDPMEKIPAEVWEFLNREPVAEDHVSNGHGQTRRVSVDLLVGRALDMARSEGRNSAGFWLAAQLRDNGYTQGEAEQVVAGDYRSGTGPNNAKGEREQYSEAEARASVREAYKRSRREPWKVRNNGGAQYNQDAGPGPDQEEPQAGPEPGKEPFEPMLKCTEMGNGERLVKMYGASFRYCGPLKKFLVFDGKRWIEDANLQMEAWAKKAVRQMYREAADISDKETREALLKWAHRSEQAGSISAMIRLAASEPGIPILLSELDANPWLFNVENGTLDLRTGKLQPHRRQDLITMLAPVKFNATAKCPRWEQFLEEVFAGHSDVPGFLQAFVGYSLTSDTREECLLFLHGSGRNGKGTVLKLLGDLLGDYSGTADFKTFISTRDDRGPRDDVANMRGRRLISAQEGKAKQHLDEGIIKWLTGGDRVRARKLHENSYEFMPTWKIMLASNHKPIITGTDTAIWSRLRLLPFDVSFAGNEDMTLKKTLEGELPGILNWAIEGCQRWQESGLPIAESVITATSEYRAESDVLGRFITECCTQDPNLRAGAQALYAAYKIWTLQVGEDDVMSGTAFGKQMTSRFEKKQGSGGAFYKGISLNPPQQ